MAIRHIKNNTLRKVAVVFFGTLTAAFFIITSIITGVYKELIDNYKFCKDLFIIAWKGE